MKVTPTAARLLRPLVAFAALLAVVALLAPTVASVASQVDGLHIKRDISFHIWKWQDDPTPPQSYAPPDCGQRRTFDLAPLVTVYSTRMAKDQPYTIGGTVTSPGERDNPGVPGDRVEIFLNLTKEQPGRSLGMATTQADGSWQLQGTLPFEMQANHYHIVAHALEMNEQCKRYREGWSDPEINITARTRLVLDGPWRSVASREVNITGGLVDDVGGPVVGQAIDIRIGGARYQALTGEDGRFRLNLTPQAVGEVPVVASYKGNAYYGESSETSKLIVLDESVTLNGVYPNGGIQLVRSTPLAVNGEVMLRPNASYAPVQVTLRGIAASFCEECAPVSNATLEVGPDGAFHMLLRADKTQPSGNFTIVVSGGGMKKTATFNGTLVIPTMLALDAHDGGVGSLNWTARLVLTDDAGPLAGAPVNLNGPGNSTSGLTAADGSFAFATSATSCGPSSVVASYGGTDFRMPANAQANLAICGAIQESTAVAPAGVPWWAWLVGALALAAVVAGIVLWRRRVAARALIIREGPPLTLSFVEPHDLAEGVVGLGESATLAVFLEAPLPEGHRLRVGTPERMEDVEVDGLQARWAIVADAYGEIAVRAEILNPRGRVVTRRTRPLRVVRYDEEIERRYKALKSAHGADARVSPRAFEDWLSARSAALRPEDARRLVRVFEEADYGPRVATRRELLTYLEAEAAIPQEVTPPADA